MREKECRWDDGIRLRHGGGRGQRGPHSRENEGGLMNDWTAFGRVDADGTVYVKTAEGDRVVGSWQAGTPEEGLAHFARRFADLVTEVDLIEARLKSGAADAAHSLTSVKRIRTGLDEAHVVGDIDGLAARLERLTALAEEKAGEARAAREVARGEALARKTALSRRPRRSPPSPPGGRARATGSRRSSTSGRPSAASTRRPTASCGSASRPPATASPAAVARISPPSTGSASRRRPPRRSWSRRPRSWPTRRNGRPRPTGSRT